MIARENTLRERFDAVLLDLDGTLLDNAYRITDRTQRAVRGLVDAGFEVLICTGRSYSGAELYHEVLDLDTAIVAYNGAWIQRPGADPWHRASVPETSFASVEQLEAAAAFSVRHHVEGKVSVLRDHPQHERIAAWYDRVSIVRRSEDLPRSELLRVSCYFDADTACEAAWTDAAGSGRDDLHRETYPMAIFPEFVGTGLHLCEVQGRGRGKAEAFRYLEAVAGISAARTIAVGDHRNDLPMLEGAGLAVVMENAAEEAKALADVVIGHHAREGVAAWIEAELDTGRDGA